MVCLGSGGGYVIVPSRESWAYRGRGGWDGCVGYHGRSRERRPEEEDVRAGNACARCIVLLHICTPEGAVGAVTVEVSQSINQAVSGALSVPQGTEDVALNRISYHCRGERTSSKVKRPWWVEVGTDGPSHQGFMCVAMGSYLCMEPSPGLVRGVRAVLN